MITLYNFNVKIEKNAYIDNLAGFLRTCPSTGSIIFQYVKHDLEVEIKLNWEQKELNEFPYNYVEIQNDNEKPYYYYVMDRKWVSKNCIKLLLSMDTVNSLGQASDSPANPRNFTDETQIIRQHGDRFYKPENFVSQNSMVLNRRIDKESEGVNTYNELASEPITVYDKNFFNDNWYIMYKTRENLEPTNIANPLGIYVFSNVSYKCKKEQVDPGTKAKEYTVDNLENGYYYFLGIDNPAGHITGIGAQHGGTLYNGILGENNLEYVVLKRYITEFNVPLLVLYTVENKNGELKVRKRGGVDPAIIKNGVLFRTYGSDLIGRSQSEIKRLVSTTKSINAVPGDVVQTRTIENIDRTDSKIMKITQLPYCPIDILFNRNNNLITLPAGWILDTDTNLLKWEYQSMPVFINEEVGNVNITELSEAIALKPTIYDKKKVFNESKIYNSEFSTFKMIYGNQSVLIPLERITRDATSKEVMSIDFKASNSAANGFMFKLNYDELGGLAKTSEFEDFMLVERNNDLTILSNDYVNYIRNGYNYDTEANRLAKNKAIMDAVLGVSEAGGRFLSQNGGAIQAGIQRADAVRYSNATQGYSDSPIDAFVGGFRGFNSRKVLSGAVAEGLVSQQIIGAGINAIRTAANIWQQSQSQENQMASKQAQLAAQATSISGSSDIDLLEWYAGNKLKLVKYEPREEIKHQLYDLFDLYGYARNKYEKPNVDSRIWYNYLQCEPKMEFNQPKHWKQTWINDLKLRYAAGVSVFHEINGKWNLEQEHENWETWLV